MSLENTYDDTSAILTQFIERIERLESEKQDIADGIKLVYHEVKGAGFDVKTVRQLIKYRKMEHHQLEEQQYLLATYAKAISLPGFFALEDDSKNDDHFAEEE